MKSLKILFVLQTPWGTGLGASKVHFDLKYEYEKLGHQVDYLDWNKLYPKGQNAYNKIFGSLYTQRIHNYLKEHAYKYDVIDANNYCIPFSKESYNFKGVVVFRSHGLPPLYRQLEQSAPYKKMEAVSTNRISLKTKGGNMYRFLQKKEGDYELFHSIKYADVVHALNVAEYNYFIEYGISKDKVVLIPNGVPDAQLKALENVQINEKKAEISFIGSWTFRKGIKDLNSIVVNIQEKVSLVQLNILGGGGVSNNVYPFFDKKYHSLLKIKPVFSQDEVPGILRKTKVGVFPSYAEGFGLAIVEQLALGIPVIAYDTPGPSDILEPLNEKLLVKVGDTDAFAKRVAEVLLLANEDYKILSDKCQKRAEFYKMSTIAQQFLSVYNSALETLARKVL